MPRIDKALRYVDVADRIRTWIRRGRYEAGAILPGQREIAREFGVSRDSVKRALRVLEEQGAISTIPSVGCRVESADEGRLRVGYLVVSLLDPFHAGLVRELDRVLAERGGALTVSEGSGPERARELGATHLIKEYYDGCGWQRDPEGAVYIGGAPRGRHGIVSDDATGMRLVYEHLRGLGHGRIGYLGMRGAAARSRLDALAAAMAADGRELAAGDTFLTGKTDEGIARAVASLAARDDRPTALVCYDDCRAASVVRHATRAGLRVPDDLSVTGFDDCVLATQLSVRLTTASFSAARIAEEAVDILRTPPGGASERRVVESELRVRESTAPAPR